MRVHAEYAAALVLDALGAGGALLIASRDWQTVVTPRGRPFPGADVLPLSGRTIDAAPTALALVALAGVVAVLATRGLARRVIGALVVLAGAGMIWRSALAVSAVGASRARSLVRLKHPRVSLSSTVVPHVTAHAVWGVLSLVCGALALLGGVLVAARGGSWGTMSARYDAPGTRRRVDGAEVARHKAEAALWGALDRGEDPTGHDPRESE